VIGRNDTERKDTQYNNKLNATLSVMVVLLCFVIYADCHESLLLMLSVIKLSVIMLSGMAPCDYVTKQIA
jgi:hypothetical protein